jgi:hypothetical protein
LAFCDFSLEKSFQAGTYYFGKFWPARQKIFENRDFVNRTTQMARMSRMGDRTENWAS